MARIYRTDIDTLRAISIISVILFHLGYIKNGYLGVDVFFVISGYLITGIIYNEISANKFSVKNFYERRIRRIIPLVLFISALSFIIGLLVMLPDDLENLCQSIFATNFFSNNILMKITSSDYWAIKNNYKPLMHTWSLGIEEQFYLTYPIIFFFTKGEKRKYILPTLMTLASLSLLFFITSNNSSAKFYYLHFRFFQLAIGGLFAIFFINRKPKQSKNHSLLLIFLILLIFVIYSNINFSRDFLTITTTLLTAFILFLGNFFYKNNSLYKTLTSNKIIAGIGKISFSLYMWHQMIFAFSRYFLFEEITPQLAIILTIVIFICSIFTYHFIENPFRNRQLISLKKTLAFLTVFFILIISSSFYVYMIGGIIKDVPQLGIYKNTLPTKYNFFNSEDNIHISYNEKNNLFNKPFEQTNKIKVLVIGNSFGRDFINLLIESEFYNELTISYANLNTYNYNDIKERVIEADYIFYASNYPSKEVIINEKIPMSKVWIIGPKNFGASNGIHYNKSNIDYTLYSTKMTPNIYNEEKQNKAKWKKRYISLIDLTKNNNQEVLVFTPSGKFISHDTMHFTEYGSKFYAGLLKDKLKNILKIE